MITVKTIKGIKYVYWQSTQIDGKRSEKCLGKLSFAQVKARELIEQDLDAQRQEMYKKLELPEPKQDVEGFNVVKTEYAVLQIVPPLKQALDEVSKNSGFDVKEFLTIAFTDYLYTVWGKRKLDEIKVTKEKGIWQLNKEPLAKLNIK
jgi:hypothetical protein